MSKNNLVQKTITDKNGHSRNVWVNPDKGSAGNRLGGQAVTTPPNSDKATHKKLMKPIQHALGILNSDFEKFPLKAQEAALASVTSPDADAGIYLAAFELARAAEDWNFHSFSLKLEAAISRASIADDPDAPLIHKYALASDENTPVDILRRIYDETNLANHSMASNPNTPDDILRAFVDSKTDWMTEMVSRNTGATPELLSELAESASWRVRYYVSTNPSASVKTLTFLTKDERTEVSNNAKEVLANR